jgi:hypothetical protein
MKAPRASALHRYGANAGPPDTTCRQQLRILLNMLYAAGRARRTIVPPVRCKPLAHRAGSVAGHV